MSSGDSCDIVAAARLSENRGRDKPRWSRPAVNYQANLMHLNSLRDRCKHMLIPTISDDENDILSNHGHILKKDNGIMRLVALNKIL